MQDGNLEEECFGYLKLRKIKNYPRQSESKMGCPQPCFDTGPIQQFFSDILLFYSSNIISFGGLILVVVRL
jgi:hypothetical protein